jgi:hypothetical protein
LKVITTQKRALQLVENLHCNFHGLNINNEWRFHLSPPPLFNPSQMNGKRNEQLATNEKLSPVQRLSRLVCAFLCLFSIVTILHPHDMEHWNLHSNKSSKRDGKEGIIFQMQKI